MFLSNFGKFPFLCERNTGRVDRCITLKLLHVPRSCREELVGGEHLWELDKIGQKHRNPS